MFDSDALDPMLLVPGFLDCMINWAKSHNAQFFQTPIQTRENANMRGNPSKIQKALVLENWRQEAGITVIPAAGHVLDFAGLDENLLLSQDQMGELQTFLGNSKSRNNVNDAVISITSRENRMILISNDNDHRKFAERISVSSLSSEAFKALVLSGSEPKEN